MAEESRIVVTAGEAERRLGELGEHIRAADMDRFRRLLPLFKGDRARARLDRCLDVVAPGREKRDQLAAFRAFRRRFATAAQNSRVEAVPPSNWRASNCDG